MKLRFFLPKRFDALRKTHVHQNVWLYPPLGDFLVIDLLVRDTGMVLLIRPRLQTSSSPFLRQVKMFEHGWGYRLVYAYFSTPSSVVYSLSLPFPITLFASAEFYSLNGHASLPLASKGARRHYLGKTGMLRNLLRTAPGEGFTPWLPAHFGANLCLQPSLSALRRFLRPGVLSESQRISLLSGNPFSLLLPPSQMRLGC